MGKDGRAFREVCAGVPFMDQGPLSAEAAADRLRSMDLLISPFADGLSTRRGSVIAGFQHGVAVASTWSSHTDALFREDGPKYLILRPFGNLPAFLGGIEEWLEIGSKEVEETEKWGSFFKVFFVAGAGAQAAGLPPIRDSIPELEPSGESFSTRNDDETKSNESKEKPRFSY